MVEVVRRAFAALGTDVDALRQEIAMLRRRLDADSRTSSKPPSTDLSRLSRAARTRSLREVSGRSPGGQPGHDGVTLAWRQVPDAVVTHRPTTCAECGRSLERSLELQVLEEGVERVVERAQVIDLPAIVLKTTEHRRVAIVCAACGHESVAAFPPGILVGTQYGPEMKALAVALHSYHFLPYARTAELLDSIVGDGPSAGSLVNWTRQAAEALAPADQATAAVIAASPSVHADETGLHVARRTWWLHVASTATHTHYHVDRLRSFPAMERGGVLPYVRGTIVHDALNSYFSFDEATHQLCIAHLTREARGLVELTRDLSPAKRPERWLVEIDALLGRLHLLVTRAAAAGRPSLDARTVRRLTVAYDRIVNGARRLHPYPISDRKKTDGTGRRPGRVRRGPVASFADRLLKYRSEVLRCASDTRVAPDNNQAERDLRMAKLADKISGGFRTREASEAFAIIRGVLSTARKQGRTAIARLREVYALEPAVDPVLCG